MDPVKPVKAGDTVVFCFIGISGPAVSGKRLAMRMPQGRRWAAAEPPVLLKAARGRVQNPSGYRPEPAAISVFPAGIPAQRERREQIVARVPWSKSGRRHESSAWGRGPPRGRESLDLGKRHRGQPGEWRRRLRVRPIGPGSAEVIPHRPQITAARISHVRVAGVPVLLEGSEALETGPLKGLDHGREIHHPSADGREAAHQTVDVTHMNIHDVPFELVDGHGRVFALQLDPTHIEVDTQRRIPNPVPEPQ
jgi:hypothetical protein